MANLRTLSCGSQSNCSAGGQYRDGSNHQRACVVIEWSGVWGKAREVPGLGILNVRGTALLESVSCASAGHCTVGGSYVSGSPQVQGFIVIES
jgi:hypothetical protein